jgi:hypothetical protein
LPCRGGGGHIGCHIVPIRCGAFQLDGAWPPDRGRASGEDNSHPSEEAGL